LIIEIHTRAPSGIHVVHHPGGLQGQETRLFDVHARVGDDIDVRPEPRQGLAEGLAGRGAAAHEFQGALCGAEGAHAVVNPSGAEAALGDLEAAPRTENDVVLRHAHVIEAQVHVAVRRIVHGEHLHRTQDLDPGRVHGHENL
jgi:hypothetical protein